MYLSSALIGPSDACPAPPVFMGSLQSVLESGPPPLCAGANIMQTNTPFVVWHFSRRPAGVGESREGEREKGASVMGG